MSTPQTEKGLSGEIDVVALEAFLLQRSCSLPLKTGLRIRPADQGSGFTDTSINHDQVIVDHQAESSR